MTEVALDAGSFDLALAREHLADPLGEPSPALRALLDRMRDEPPAGRLVVLADADGARFRLAELTGRRGDTPIIHELPPFESVAAAARAIFRLRWKRLTGGDLTIAL